MESLYLFLLIFQVALTVFLITFILIQHGKGADAGAAFGSAASATIFGSQGSGNFMTKITMILAFLFLSNSLYLGYMATKRIENSSSIMESSSLMAEDIATAEAQIEEMMADDKELATETVIVPASQESTSPPEPEPGPDIPTIPVE